MFNRPKFKKDAKEQLKGNYVLAVLSSLIITAITIIIKLSTARLSSKPVANFFIVIFSFIVAAVLRYAYLSLCTKIADKKEKVTFNDFTSGLSLAKPAILAELWKSLFLILWALICIIPITAIVVVLAVSSLLKTLGGSPSAQMIENYFDMLFSDPEMFTSWIVNIFSDYLVIALIAVILFILFIIIMIVKRLQYSQMEYIITENKNISVRKAMRLSIEFTKGNKGNLFVMALSFIGWFLPILVATIPIHSSNLSNPDKKMFISIIGSILASFIIPYITVAFINAYRSIKSTTLNAGNVNQEDIQ